MKLLRRILASAVVASCLITSGTATPPTSAKVAAADRTVRLAPLGLGVDLPNPLRGQYRWMGYGPTPTMATSNDIYFRDQVYWGRIEKADNVWDFTWIDAGLADAGARGGTFGFRVMAYCPGCWMESRSDWPAVTPSFVPRQTGGYIPDWNSPAFLAQWRELMAELGRRYGNDPRLGYVDVGGYGSYGEWHVDAGERVTDANGLAIVKAVTDAFSTKHVLINTMTPVPFTLAALDANRNLGMRTDSLGCPDMYSMAAVDARLQKVWKTRPFFSEWCTRADPVLGAQQVRQFHISTMSSANMPWDYDALTSRQRSAYDSALATAGYRLRLRSVTMPKVVAAGSRLTVGTTWTNLGSAPTYDAWDVQLAFAPAAGGAPVIRSLGQPLKRLMGTKVRRATIGTTGLAKGKYVVSLSVVDPSGYADPMHLATAGRTGAGAYRVGAIKVS